jgi:hypothetical protein
MVTRSEFRFGLLFFLAAIVPPSIWVPQELCYWLDGYRPLDASEAAGAMGSGTRCTGMYCSLTFRGLCKSSPSEGAGCMGRDWTCALSHCTSCNAPPNTWYRLCRTSTFPDSVCTANNSGTTPCGNKTKASCIWALAGTLWFCSCPATLPVTEDACDQSDCT